MRWSIFEVYSAKPLRGHWWAIALGLVWLGGLPQLGAQPPAASSTPDSRQQALFDAFTRSMTNVRLKGHFTVVKEGETKTGQEEEYTIRQVRKLPRGDQWLFQARIRYAKVDVTLPLVLNVQWAGTTPVITLESVKIPALGTFSARVLFHGDRYAGTWQHGDNGGHLFGIIEKLDDNQPVEDGDNASK